MSHYKYYITLDDGKWKFGLYPNNNNSFYVISSNRFETYNECLQARLDFITQVSLRRENAFRIEKIGTSKYLLVFHYDNIEITHIEKNTTLCRKKMERIIKNINAPLEVQG